MPKNMFNRFFPLLPFRDVIFAAYKQISPFLRKSKTKIFPIITYHVKGHGLKKLEKALKPLALNNSKMSTLQLASIYSYDRTTHSNKYPHYITTYS